MLSRVFVALLGFPRLKKKVWRALYDFLARSQRSEEWTFMNYGFAGADDSPLELNAADEPDRHCIQLYHHVAGSLNMEGKVVVEVGSGRGGGASFITRYLAPRRMLGVDLSRNAVELSRRRHRIDGLEFQVGDAENLPLDADSVDAVINVESSHCYPSFEKFVAEVQRVLKPGGHFLYADFRDRENSEVWRQSLRSSGLTLLRETDITSNVVAALDRDNERKRAFIERIVPKPLQPSFNDFAGMKGTVIYDGFRSGQMIYKSFVLRKLPHN